MALNTESLERLNDLQHKLWADAATVVTLGFGKESHFSASITSVAKVEELAASMPGPMLAMQFGLSTIPNSELLLLLTPEFGSQLAAQALNVEVPELTDEALAGATGAFQSLVTGACEGMTAIFGERVDATGFSLQRQIVELPPSLLGAAELHRIQIELTVGAASGSIVWVFDEDVAKAMLKSSSFVDEAELSAAPECAGQRETSEMDVILDIPLQVSVELGRMTMLVKDVVELGTGSIVEVDKSAGDPVDVLVNGKLVARGEVVVIEDNFGVRITEIISPKERVTKLAEAA